MLIDPLKNISACSKGTQIRHCAFLYYQKSNRKMLTLWWSFPSLKQGGKIISQFSKLCIKSCFSCFLRVQALLQKYAAFPAEVNKHNSNKWTVSWSCSVHLQHVGRSAPAGCSMHRGESAQRAALCWRHGTRISFFAFFKFSENNRTLMVNKAQEFLFFNSSELIIRYIWSLFNTIS